MFPHIVQLRDFRSSNTLYSLRLPLTTSNIASLSHSRTTSDHFTTRRNLRTERAKYYENCFHSASIGMTFVMPGGSDTERDFANLMKLIEQDRMAGDNAPPTDATAQDLEGSKELNKAMGNMPLGLVAPPVSIRLMIERTAGSLSRNPQLMTRIRERADPRLSFVNENDLYHPFFSWRLEEVKAGRTTGIASGQTQENGTTGVSGQGRAVRQGPPKPPDFQFSARRPIINSKDEAAIKQVALFVAKNGKAWGIQLSQREAHNPEFDFMRPHHSLHQFYMRHVEQYESVMAGGKIEEKRVKELESIMEKAHIQEDGTTSKSGRRKLIERARDRAEYTKWERKQRVFKDEEAEKERIAFMEIDWHDFKIVDTITFEAEDDEADFPAPTTKHDLQHQSLEQRAARRIKPDMRLEEGMVGEMDGVMPQAQAPAGWQPPPAPHMGPLGPQMPPQGPYGMPGPQMPPGFSPQPQQPFAPPQQPAYSPAPQQNQGWGPPVQHTDETRAATLIADRERARAAMMNSSAPPATNIRENYVPAAQARQQRNNEPASVCPNCRQMIKHSEMAEHLKVELMDPRYNDQRKVAQARHASTNLYTGNAAQNLKRWHDARDGGQGAALSKEEEERRKRVELGSYDGTPQMSGGGQPGGQYTQQYGGQAPGQQNPQQQMDMAAQMARIYAKAGNNQGQQQQQGPPQ